MLYPPKAGDVGVAAGRAVRQQRLQVKLRFG
jgi:hypothetical protein